MAGGGGNSAPAQTTQTQKAEPWEGAQPYLRDVYTRAQTAANNTSTDAYTGNFVTPATPGQRDALGYARSAVANLDTGAGIRRVADQSLSGDMLNGNPYLQEAINSTINPTVRGVADRLLPAAGSAAQSAGAYGGSRDALTRRWIVDDATRNAGEIAAKMWNDNYGRERTIQTTVAPQLVQTSNALSMAPAQTLLEIANQEYGLNDLTTQNQRAAFEDEINRHWRSINPYIAALSGIGMPGGTTTTTGNAAVPRGNTALSGALGGAAAGLPLAGATYGASIPIGALLGWLGGR